MKASQFSKASLLLASAWFASEAAAAASNGDRVLRAASRRSDVFKRSVRIQKRYSAALSFVDSENGWTDDEVFASQVKVGSTSPIFNIEEHEHHLHDLNCESGSMKLRFVDKVSASDAMHACSEGLIITSHEGCNADGERSVYKVHNVNVAEDGLALELAVAEAAWKEAFSTFEVDFGHTKDNHIYRRHSDFKKIRRQEEEVAATVPAPVASGAIEIPANTPEDVNSATFDLSSERIDTVFQRDEFLNGLENFVPLPNIPEIPDLPVEIGCTNCSTTGSLVLTQGAISIDMTQIDLVPDVFEEGDDNRDLLSVITGGFFEVAATGVGAHVELFARPSASGEFEVTFLQLPIAGFVIPGIGQAGVNFEATLEASFELTEPGVTINYGFDVEVPDNSAIRVELVDLPGSGITGFAESTLTPLPVTATISDIEIQLGIALVPSIPIGFEFFDQLEASVTVSMDLPRVDLLLSTNADGVCEETPAEPEGTVVPITDVPEAIADLGLPAVVEGNISFSFDVEMSLQIPILPEEFNSVGTEANIFETTFTLERGCLSTGEPIQPPPPTGVPGIVYSSEPVHPPVEAIPLTSYPAEWAPEHPPAASTSCPPSAMETEYVEHPVVTAPPAEPHPPPPAETHVPPPAETPHVPPPAETPHVPPPAETPHVPPPAETPHVPPPAETPHVPPPAETPHVPPPAETPHVPPPAETPHIPPPAETQHIPPPAETPHVPPPAETAIVPPPPPPVESPPYAIPGNTTIPASGVPLPTANGTAPPAEFTGGAVPMAVNSIFGFGYQGLVVAFAAVAGAMFMC